MLNNLLLTNCKEAEMSLLAGMILNDAVIDVIAQKVSPDDFYSGRHRIIFETILAVRGQGQVADLVAVKYQLENTGKLKTCGGVEYLMEILESVPSIENAEYYADIVKDASIRRSATSGLTQAVSLFQKSERSTQEILGDVLELVCNLAINRGTGVVPLRVALDEAYVKLEKAHKGEIVGLSTGYYDLDNLLGGLHECELYVLAGRPSMGKSSLAWNLVRHIGINSQTPTLVFSLEVGQSQCASNLIAQEGRLEGWRFRKGAITSDGWIGITNTINKIYESPVYLADKTNLTVSDLFVVGRYAKAKYDIRFIVVDYLQLLGGKGESRQQEVSNISAGLKRLAMELRVPVLALSQLNRMVESREDKRPKLAELRESGSIEQDADVVMLMYRDDYYKRLNEVKDFVAEVIVAKHRAGPTGVVRLYFDDKSLRFENLAVKESGNV